MEKYCCHCVRWLVISVLCAYFIHLWLNILHLCTRIIPDPFDELSCYPSFTVMIFCSDMIFASDQTVSLTLKSGKH